MTIFIRMPENGFRNDGRMRHGANTKGITGVL